MVAAWVLSLQANSGNKAELNNAAICYMLEDWSGMDRGKTKEYILKFQSYDGGFGMSPGSESHDVSTEFVTDSLLLAKKSRLQTLLL
ncbi:hypothetical protein DKX38_016360 [Salix brachista]|uniref:Prenyltransferase alpha-alpha toroid domain-containing protein n=1 Tax=Salix brachista TaxID=2182728 RepID=A0A5N5L7S0_9ROSI|nr:hypothetical protein DKX38_016360 [Salix brachista]